MSLLVYRTFGGRRANPSAEKVVRDGERMYSLARRVLVIDDKAKVVEDIRNTDKLSMDCIVVLGPVVHQGLLIPKAVLLEIGLKRFVPYARATFLKKGEDIQPRAAIARLSDRTQYNLLPTISKVIQEEVDAIVLSWKNTKLWTRVAKTRSLFSWEKVDHSYELNQRVFVKVPKEDYMLSAAMMLREREWRESERKHYDVAAESAREKLRDFLRISGSGVDVEDILRSKIKRSSLCSMVASSFIVKIRNKSYKKHAIENILNRIGAENSRERQLLARIFEIHKVPEAPEEEIVVFKPPFEINGTHLLEKLGKLISYRSLRHTDRRKVHASNSIVFTVLCSDECQKAMEERTIARHTAKAITDDDPDSDIPF